MSELNAPSSIGEAATFVTDATSGQVAILFATIGLACVGLAMLTGRLDLRRGGAAILGCFLMIGAPVIARGILGFGAPALPPSAANALPDSALLTPPPEAKKVQKSADPYAGASLVN